jgi:hypothetical protein
MDVIYEESCWGKLIFPTNLMGRYEISLYAKWIIFTNNEFPGVKATNYDTDKESYEKYDRRDPPKIGSEFDTEFLKIVGDFFNEEKGFHIYIQTSPCERSDEEDESKILNNIAICRGYISTCCKGYQFEMEVSPEIQEFLMANRDLDDYLALFLKHHHAVAELWESKVILKQLGHNH